MAKKAEFVGSQNNERPGKAFLLEYQRSVLLALEQEGILDREQLADCIRKLEKQSG
ncbi:hypothetical protein [Pseudoflavonifractor phocaeensis]|uniref:hypothetical protein n=1 Tax=Pseudoflavonifractor phocaeensis TaxID=1870988 RepID=UPI001F29251F|nr:hypothetical protein [Pseudoflavonifractor phocaeensis]MCF2595870.1 hypothetical protein [Pseudoflavonifractor phocaeensis]